MTKKSEKIGEMVKQFEGGGLSPHYVGYFECFNQGLYYEAHDVLEDLWLRVRKQPNDLFYKGLIQLAGAFVHLQKNRLRPAGALFRLADTNLSLYPDLYESLDVVGVRSLIADWLAALPEGNVGENPLQKKTAPRISPAR